MNRNHWLCGALFLFSFLLWLSAPIARAEPYWEQVPLKTRAQAEAGFSGGDGFQYVHALAYAPSDASRAYLSVDTSAVWRSDDGGLSWRPVFNGFVAYGGRSLAVDPLNPDIVVVAGFLGFDKKRADKYGNKLQGIFITRDGGKSWHIKHKIDFFKQESKGELFVFTPTAEDRGHTSRIFCGSYEDGLLVSDDGGETWRSVGFKHEEIVSLAAGRDHALLVATTRGLYKHVGSVTTPIGAGLPSWPRSIATSRADPAVVYAAMGPHGIYKSVDGGKSFISCGAGLKSANWTDVSASPADAAQVYARSHFRNLPPYYSKDGGHSWHPPQVADQGGILGKPGFYFSSPFAPHPTEPGTALHVTNGRARIVRTEDGGVSWRYSGDGFTGARMVDATWLDDGSHIFALTDHGLWRSQENGIYAPLPVERVFGQLSSSAIASRGPHIIASLGQWTKKGIVVSHDSGNTWKYFEGFPGRFNFIAFSPTETDTVFAGEMVSRDDGQSWRPLGHTVSAMSADGKLYALSTDGVGLKKRYIWASTDNGRSWSLHGAAPVSLAQIRDVAVDPSDGNRLFLATSTGLFISRGKSWALRDDKVGLAKDAFGECYIEKILFSPGNPKRIFVGRRSVGRGRANGIFQSDDGGQTWTDANYNLSPGVTVFGLVADPKTGTVYLGSSFGTFRLVQRGDASASVKKSSD